MIKAFLFWLLRLLGFDKLSVAMEGAEEALRKDEAAGISAAEEAQDEIVERSNEEIGMVDGMSADERLDAAVDLGLVRDGASEDDWGG